MRIRLYEAVIIIIFGVLLPAVLVSFMRKPESMSTAPETVSVKEAEKESTVMVMCEGETIERMDLSEYLVGVILREMPAKFEMEALKAQAVVARTYVMKRKNFGNEHTPADICTQSSCCQGFRTVADYLSDHGKIENVEKIRAAVSATEGEVLTYNGKLIDATYFSCSGGMTEDALAVWGTDVPYLQSTTSPGEETAKHYIETVTFNCREFAEALGLKTSNPLTIDYISYTTGGGVDKISICGRTIEGTTLRKKLNLNSTAALLSIVGDTVTVTTKGNGHRVGMSQYGANAMAEKGATYQDILLHYYAGVSLVREPLD